MEYLGPNVVVTIIVKHVAGTRRATIRRVEEEIGIDAAGSRVTADGLRGILRLLVQHTEDLAETIK